MARTHDGITEELATFITGQHVFFVGTAPSGDDGHVNVSPKGLDTFRVVDDHTVAGLDLTGSGIETASHLRDNGRVVVMFCAFEGPPRIVRFHGRGEVLTLDDPAAATLLTHFPEYPGSRSVIRVDVERIATSCGYAVPLMEYQGERSTLIEWAERKGPAGVADYRAETNRASIDGLPGLV
jgi:hypothetical protein